MDHLEPEEFVGHFVQTDGSWDNSETRECIFFLSKRDAGNNFSP